MKTLGDLVRAWRIESGLGFAELARMVNMHLTVRARQRPVKYQDLQNLEKGEAKNPRYLSALAKAMGTTAEALDSLRKPPPLSATAQDTAPPPTAHTADFSDRDLAALQEIRDMEAAPPLARKLEALRAELAEWKGFAMRLNQRMEDAPKAPAQEAPADTPGVRAEVKGAYKLPMSLQEQAAKRAAEQGKIGKAGKK